MSHGHKVSCVLCQRSEETKITGALSTKDQVTAHQNCLLFSSGIYCRDSPEFDDLFGFSVEDVMTEVKRGSKLTCNKCKKKGATAGCEIKRCQKSYHYPCAVEDGAETVEDGDRGNYGLYCIRHHQQLQKNNGSVNGCASSFTKPRTSKSPSKAGSSKGNTSGDSTVAGPSVCSSDSNSSSSATRLSKRRLSFNDNQEDTPSKRKSEDWKRKISDNSSNSDEDEPNADMAIFAPLESDLDESANSVPELELIRKDAEIPTGPTSGTQLEDESRDGNTDKDETIIDSDAESESLLLPVEICMESQSCSATSAANSTVLTADPGVILVKAVEVVQREDKGSSPVHSPGQHTAGPSVPQQSSAASPPSPDHAKPRSVTGSPPCTSSAVSPALAETICVSLLSSSPSPEVLPSDPEPSINSTGFWKSCNAAGCTQAIFADFITEMSAISRRIQSDQASQEDYDRALTVMSASGTLAELVTKQQKELQRKQVELRKATAAMKDVVSALSSRVHQQLL